MRADMHSKRARRARRGEYSANEVDHAHGFGANYRCRWCPIVERLCPVDCNKMCNFSTKLFLAAKLVQLCWQMISGRKARRALAYTYQHIGYERRVIIVKDIQFRSSYCWLEDKVCDKLMIMTFGRLKLMRKRGDAADNLFNTRSNHCDWWRHQQNVLFITFLTKIRGIQCPELSAFQAQHTPPPAFKHRHNRKNCHDIHKSFASHTNHDIQSLLQRNNPTKANSLQRSAGTDKCIWAASRIVLGRTAQCLLNLLVRAPPFLPRARARAANSIAFAVCIVGAHYCSFVLI